MDDERILTGVATVVRRFIAGEAGPDEVQAALQVALPLLERSPAVAALAAAVATAEGDLELIRFTVFGDAVRPAVIAALAPLLAHLPEHPEHHCRACGYDWGAPPWGDDGESPDFDICPCCQVEAGYEDITAEGARAYRAQWLSRGAPWTDRSTPQDGLSTEERLRHLPPGFE